MTMSRGRVGGRTVGALYGLFVFLMMVFLALCLVLPRSQCFGGKVFGLPARTSRLEWLSASVVPTRRIAAPPEACARSLVVEVLQERESLVGSAAGSGCGVLGVSAKVFAASLGLGSAAPGVVSCRSLVLTPRRVGRVR